MENKKIDVLFGVVVIAFLLVAIILIKEFNAKRANNYKEYAATIANIVKMKNDRIIILANRLAVAEKENVDLKNTLALTRNDLDALSKKIAQPAPAALTASAPAATATK